MSGAEAGAGARNAVGHDAQPVYREALTFSVLSRSEAIRDVNLNRL